MKILLGEQTFLYRRRRRTDHVTCLKPLQVNKTQSVYNSSLEYCAFLLDNLVVRHASLVESHGGIPRLYDLTPQHKEGREKV